MGVDNERLCVATKILNLKAIPSAGNGLGNAKGLCVATKILNLKAIPSRLERVQERGAAVRCNKNTKSESYSQYFKK